MRHSRPFLRQVALSVLFAAAVLAQAAPGRIVGRPVLNMYSSATTDADVVSQAIYATPVAVVEEKDGWAKIRTPDDYTGWVEASALLQGGTAVYGSGPATVQVRSLFAHVYREMDVTKHAPLLTVPFETKLEVAGSDAKKSERWLQVKLPDGRTAFIQNADVGPVVSNLTVPQTLELAKKFLGMPYTWGGTSSYGFDCSGFTQMLMRQRGYNMPRDAGPQANWTGVAPVEQSALQPGDLLFFGSSPTRVTHTGMYLGDNLFINATTHGTPMVRIDNLADAYWTKLLVGARRVR
ncbi:MAG: NlpC/P60 family protein [Bacteroidales bacterium]